MASIACCVTCTQDDMDVCINAVRSVADWVDEIWLADTGPAALRRVVRETVPTPYDFYETYKEDYPLRYALVPWGVGGDHALVHNRMGEQLARMKFSWVYWIDTDEVCTYELAADYKRLADEVDPKVVTIAARLLTLFPDEQHYAVRYSKMLSHGRFYRPDKVQWTGAWHEHQIYHGDRLDLSERFHVHLRQMLQNRCRRQHGHGPEGWRDLLEEGVGEVKDLPATWPTLYIPEEDRP